ncbi:hypothetical protein MMC16_004621 [Acarospora aff. strigata]|nr:hypothetical protein [Acarospora aff. strigata]
MAYTAVAQKSHDIPADNRGSDYLSSNTSSSPRLPGNGYTSRPLCIDVDSLDGIGSLQSGGTREQTGSDHLSLLVKSISSSDTSYDMLSENGHDRQEDGRDRHKTPRTRQMLHQENQCPREDTATTVAAEYGRISVPSSPLDPIMRTASRDDTVPLRHPTPDIQSLHGAYINNVARLEETAERLSLTSNAREDLNGDIFRYKTARSNQSSLVGADVVGATTMPSVTRHLSSSSISRPRVSLNGLPSSRGYSSGGYLPSPKGSIGSGSWSHVSNRVRSASRGSRLTQLSEPDQGDAAPTLALPGICSPNTASNEPSSNRLMPGTEGNTTINHSSWLDPVSQFSQHLHVQNPGPEENQEMPERPRTAASTDTHRQVNSLFVDFDGVHFTDHNEETSSTGLRTSENMRFRSRPQSLARPQSYAETLAAKNMVYYPAPVPLMLNLPQRLSKLPSSTEREKRRSQVLSGMFTDSPTSATWLPELLEDGHDDGANLSNPGFPQRKSVDSPRRSKNLAVLPPQLRASAFFDQPSTRQEVEVKGDSAVATLDSILDASANAPVNAFVDHPIAGRVGTEVYGMENPGKSTVDVKYQKSKARNSRSSLMLQPNVISSLNFEETAAKRVSWNGIGAESGKRESIGRHKDESEGEQSALTSQLTPSRELFEPRQVAEDATTSEENEEYQDPGENMELQENSKAHDDSQPGGNQPGYLARPTTLLAELQLRKKEQRLRNRTAANTFPNGMHSTLLQLDVVAQVQKQSRKHKHITLAWEDPNAQFSGTGNLDDENIPLAMLFPGQNVSSGRSTGQFEVIRSMGLMEKRELEDNEPLSQRRARLRGHHQASRSRSPAKRNSAMYTLEVPGLTNIKVEEAEGAEGETLAQRMKRLKAQGQTPTGLQSRPISGDFAGEIMSQLGGVMQAGEERGDEQALETEEETLGQRRRRLHAEQEARSREALRGDGPARSSSRPPLKARPSMANILQSHPAAGAGQMSSEKAPLATLPGCSVENRALKGLLYQDQYTSPQAGLPVDHAKSVTLAGPDPSLDVVHQRRPKLGDFRRATSGSPYDAGVIDSAAGIRIPAYHSYSSDPNRSRKVLNGHEDSTNFQTFMGYGQSTMAMDASGHSLLYSGGLPQRGVTAIPMGQVPIALDLNRRDMIDRWRQSVMY